MSERREIEGLFDIVGWVMLIAVCVLVLTLKSCIQDPLGSAERPIRVEVTK